METTIPTTMAPRYWPARALLVCGLLGLLLAFHVPTHLVSALGRLTGNRAWIDAFHLPTTLGPLFWVAPVLLALGVAVRNGAHSVAAEERSALPDRPVRPALARWDLVLAAGITLGALGLRIAPLLADPWLKPEYDEGVYLGGAWLMRGGALPYRDWVFAHLPGSLLMLMPAAATIQAGHDNTTALLLARLTASLADAVAAGAVYLAARQLVAVPGALLAGFVYAADARAVEYSRQVLLEPLQAPWLLGGAALLLAQINRREHRRGAAVAAGVLMAIGISVKLSGAVVPLAAFAALAAMRRPRLLLDLAIGVALGALLTCSWSLAVSGDEIVRQTVLLQAGRSTAQVFDFWAWLMGDYTAAFTALMAMLGAGALALQAWRGRLASGWIFVLLWLALVFLLFARIPSFYVHYYDKLLAPAALLAAAAVEPLTRRPLLLAPLGIVAAALLYGQAIQWQVVDRAPTLRPALERLASQPSDRPLLTLEPIVNVLSGRPVVRAPGGPYLLDMFLGEPYFDSPLNRRWPDAATVRAEALAASDGAMLAANDLGRFGPLGYDFDCRPAGSLSNMQLCRRYPLLATLRDGPDLELLEVAASEVAEQDGQRWLTVQLRWRAPTTPPDDLALALHVLDGAGAPVAQLDVPASGGVAWQPDAVTTQEYRVPLPAVLAPGEYALKLILYSWQSGQPFMLAPEGGDAPVTALDLPPVVVP